jgi:outer membrane protein assembly factor BamE (lipoprotein component of BamABCDE complex)
MKPRRLIPLLLSAALVAGCGLLVVGADFPSPTKDMIQTGKTTKTNLLRFFGEPYQVGIDSGDLTWRWFYAQKYSGGEISKDLTVRFDDKGVVKSYSFNSNDPADMARLK